MEYDDEEIMDALQLLTNTLWGCLNRWMVSSAFQNYSLPHNKIDWNTIPHRFVVFNCDFIYANYSQVTRECGCTCSGGLCGILDNTIYLYNVSYYWTNNNRLMKSARNWFDLTNTSDRATWDGRSNWQLLDKWHDEGEQWLDPSHCVLK